MNWILWAILIAALLHIVEEYWGGWLDWVQHYVPGVTLLHFVFVNVVFVFLCVAGAVVGTRNIVFSLSIASLVFINALMHIIPTVLQKHYSPGVVTALLFYIPLAIYAYILAFERRELSFIKGGTAIILGAFWMAIPIIFQQVRVKVTKN